MLKTIIIDIIPPIVFFFIFLKTKDEGIYKWLIPIAYLVWCVIAIVRKVAAKYFPRLIIKDDIRVSMSYIYIIKVDGKYLLVKNSHNKGYQFVGGKYKYREGAKSIFDKLKIKDDTKLGNANQRKIDIAFFVPSSKFGAFKRWFNSEKYRELDHYREFKEELLMTSKTSVPLLPEEKFKDVRFEKKCVVETPIKRAPVESGFNCWEYLRYDVLIPNFTDEQMEELRKLKEKGDTEDVKWAGESLISNYGFEEGKAEKEYKINEHTKWCLEGKYTGDVLTWGF